MRCDWQFLKDFSVTLHLIGGFLFVGHGGVNQLGGMFVNGGAGAPGSQTL